MKKTINHVCVEIDDQTGSLLKLQREDGSVLLNANPEEASLIDVACPILDFEPLRSASRFSKGG